jgi:hypothetical protein
LLSVLLASVISLAVGYFLGLHFSPPVSTAPVAIAPPAPPPAPVAPVIPEPAETMVETQPAPVPEASPPPEKTPEPVKASAAAEAALKAFLDAPDWSTRAAHALAPDKVRAAMEAYSHKVPDGPTAFRSVSIQNSYTDKSTGNTLFIFQVVTEAHASGFPVAVVETESGWQVDWKAFVEFRDDHFKSFADGPTGENGRFHVIVSTPPADRAAKTANEHFSSFLLDPPMPGRQRLAYVRKPSAIHDTLVAATANGAVFTPVLELAKQKAPDGKTYLEITGIAASDWLPEDR